MQQTNKSKTKQSIIITFILFILLINPLGAQTLNHMENNKTQIITNKRIIDKINIAKSKQTSPEILKKLSKDSSISVQSAVANNPNTPTQTLIEISKTDNKELARQVARNPNTPEEGKTILRELGDTVIDFLLSSATDLITERGKQQKQPDMTNQYQDLSKAMELLNRYKPSGKPIQPREFNLKKPDNICSNTNLPSEVFVGYNLNIGDIYEFDHTFDIDTTMNGNFGFNQGTQTHVNLQFSTEVINKQENGNIVLQTIIQNANISQEGPISISFNSKNPEDLKRAQNDPFLKPMLLLLYIPSEVIVGPSGGILKLERESFLDKHLPNLDPQTRRQALALFDCLFSTTLEYIFPILTNNTVRPGQVWENRQPWSNPQFSNVDFIKQNQLDCYDSQDNNNEEVVIDFTGDIDRQAYNSNTNNQFKMTEYDVKGWQKLLTKSGIQKEAETVSKMTFASSMQGFNSNMTFFAHSKTKGKQIHKL